MSEIMDSYKDMSMSELGSSLLQRKAERERSARKDSRKQQRIEQALGLLVAGQAVFKGAYKKREKELDNALAFELENNKYQAKQIEEISQIVQHLPTDFGDAKTTDEKVAQFVASPQFELFKNSVKPYADDRMKKAYRPQDWLDFSTTTGYDNTIASVAEEYDVICNMLLSSHLKYCMENKSPGAPCKEPRGTIGRLARRPTVRKLGEIC